MSLMSWDLYIVLPEKQDARGAFGDDSPRQRLGTHDDVAAKLAPLLPAMKALKVVVHIPEGDNVTTVDLSVRPKGDPNIEPRHPIWALIHDIQKETGWRVVDTWSGELVELDGTTKARPQNEPWNLTALRATPEMKTKAELGDYIPKWPELGSQDEVRALLLELFPGAKEERGPVHYLKWKTENYVIRSSFVDQKVIRYVDFQVSGYNGGPRKKEHPSREVFRKLAERTGWRLADQWTDEFID